MATAQKAPPKKVSATIVFCQEDGKPFFYLDTAWELFHRLDRKDAAEYLKTRAGQGYTVVQAVALAELDGLTDPNAYRQLPLLSKDSTHPATTPGANPSKPAEYDYWDHVDYIVDEANRNGIYVGLLPTWGRWVVKNPRQDETIFTTASAQTYGEFLGSDTAGRASSGFSAAIVLPKESRTLGARWPRESPSASRARKTTTPC
jgi:hypothetical protein